MGDLGTPLLSVDFDTGGSVERGQAINLVRRASGGSTELIGQTTMALSLPVAFASDQSALTVDLGTDNDVHGTVAHDAADADNPIKIGGKAYTTLPTAVATLDRVDSVWTTQGALTIAGVDGTTPVGIAATDDGHLITAADAASLALADNLSNTVNLKVDGAHAFIGTAVFPFMFDGTNWDRMRGAAATGLEVDIVQSVALTVDLGANNDVVVAGDIAHDAVDSGNPIKIGGKAYTTLPSAVADADRVDAVFTDQGALTIAGVNGTTPLGLVANAAGQLEVDEPNIISTDNSTTSTLLSAASYVGTSEDVSDDSTVTVTIDASHDSAVDGMTFEFSPDGTNWDDVYVFTYTAADGARHFQFPVTAQWFRVNYTNGGTGQTHFRVQTILHRNATLTTIHRIVDDLSPDRSAQIMKSVIIAQAGGSGDFIPVQATNNGNFKIALEEYEGVPAGSGTAAGSLRVELPTDGTGLVGVEGDVAHDATDSGDPIKMGGRAQDSTAQPDEVADDDRVDALFDRNGRMAVFAGSPYGHAAIDAVSSGDNELVAAQAAGKRIAVWSYAFIVNGAVTVRFESGTGGTALTGVMSFATAGDLIAMPGGGLVPLFITAAAENLNLELGGAVQVSGHLSYTVIDD